MSPRWHKVIRDLWGNKLRTVLVVLSIAVGVFAVGMVMGTSEIMFRELQKNYQAINPLEASIGADSFDADLIETVRRMPGVKDVSGARYITVRVLTGPEEWQTVQIQAVEDFNNMQVNKIMPQQGAWPPPKHELLMERGSLSLIKAKIGDTVTVELPDGHEREMRIAGTAFNVNLPPAAFAGVGFGFISLDTMEWFGFGRDFNDLQITVSQDKMNKDHISSVAKEVQEKIENGGRKTYGVYVPTPGEHPAVQILKPIMLVLTVMGFLSLILSGFLVVNTVSAILAQQTRQIGMMKAVGGRTRQVVSLYLVTVIVFGVLSLMVALPLGALAAAKFTDYMAGIINFDIKSYSMPLNILAIEVAIGLVAPLLAALYPVLAGTRLTVREALSSYGIASAKRRKQSRFIVFRFFGRLFGRLGAAMEPVRRGMRSLVSRVLSRPLLLSMRNTFRRKGRLALTLITLTLAGSLFIGIFSVRDSLNRTLDDALAYWAYDVEVAFNRPYRAEETTALAMQVPGVEQAEAWGYFSTNRKRPNGTQSDSLTIVAPPAQTELIHPMVLSGRWLRPGDENAVVINTEVTKAEPDILLGHDIILKIDDREETFNVVGIVKGVMTGKVLYVNFPYFGKVTRSVGRAFVVETVTAQHSAAFQSQIAKDLNRVYKQAGMRVSQTQTIAGLRERVDYQFQIVLVFLLVMVSLLALVGGLGLMGTMSINVLERTREIGVLRAIGAANRSVFSLVILEGLCIGLISWAAATLLAMPLSRLLSDAMGQAMIQAPLSYVFSATGPLAWLAVVVVLATIASILPARNASHISVREALAYE